MNGYEELGREFVKSYQMAKQMKDVTVEKKLSFIGQLVTNQYESMLERYDKDDIEERLEQ